MGIAFLKPSCRNVGTDNNVFPSGEISRTYATHPLHPSASLINRALALAALLLIMAGCATRIAPLDDKIAGQRLGFLHAGETTRQEIFDRLGIPAGSYEGGSVITYRMGEDSEGGMFVANAGAKIRASSFYELILVFRQDHILERYSLVRKYGNFGDRRP